MTYKKINLFFVAVIIIMIFFNLPVYNNWLNSKIFGDNTAEEFKHLDLDYRKASRWGYSYMVYQNIVGKVTDPKHAIILLPPNDYLRKIHVKNFVSPEPATFYYYTGLASVWMTSPNAEQANWELVVKGDQQIGLRKITDKKHLDSVLAFYRKFQEL